MSARSHHRVRPGPTATPRPGFDSRPAAKPDPSGFCDHTSPSGHLHTVAEPGIEGDMCESCRVERGLLEPVDVVDPALREHLGLPAEDDRLIPDPPRRRTP